MDPAVAVTTFLAVFVAELPDKTMVATMVLSTRFRHGRAVWLGATLAFATQVTIAVVAGGVLSLLPAKLVQGAVAVLFTVGAIVLVREGDEVEDESELAEGRAPKSAAGVVARTFGLVFLAEWGDLTQLATASLAARSGSPVSVWIGALTALSCVAALAVIAGRSILKVLPVRIVRRIAATIFALLAIYTVVEIIRG